MAKEIYWVRVCFEVDKEEISREHLDTLIDEMIMDNILSV